MAEDASYATVLDLDGLGRGMLVRTRAGHAVKVEGNPAHPASLGATDVFAEAAVLSLHEMFGNGGHAQPVLHVLDENELVDGIDLTRMEMLYALSLVFLFLVVATMLALAVPGVSAGCSRVLSARCWS